MKSKAVSMAFKFLHNLGSGQRAPLLQHTLSPVPLQLLRMPPSHSCQPFLFPIPVFTLLSITGLLISSRTCLDFNFIHLKVLVQFLFTQRLFGQLFFFKDFSSPEPSKLIAHSILTLTYIKFYVMFDLFHAWYFRYHFL